MRDANEWIVNGYSDCLIFTKTNSPNWFTRLDLSNRENRKKNCKCKPAFSLGSGVLNVNDPNLIIA